MTWDYFAKRVEYDAATGCILWRGRISCNGYGNLTVNGLDYRAHRVAYVLAKGPISAGRVLDHSCRRRACVNPDHLEVVTQRENVVRGVRTRGVGAKPRESTGAPAGPRSRYGPRDPSKGYSDRQLRRLRAAGELPY